MRTYEQARQELLLELASLGWTISNPKLKVPHATRQDGKFRIWFKPQSVHYTESNHPDLPHTRGDARCISYDLDMRKSSASQLVIMASYITGGW